MGVSLLTTSCFTTTEIDVIYTIAPSLVSYSFSGSSSSAAQQAADYANALILDFKSQYGQEWISTYKNQSMYKRQEKEAVEKYEEALEKFQAIHDDFVAKYKGNASDGSQFESVYELRLMRMEPSKGSETVRSSEEVSFVFE